MIHVKEINTDKSISRDIKIIKQSLPEQRTIRLVTLREFAKGLLADRVTGLSGTTSFFPSLYPSSHDTY